MAIASFLRRLNNIDYLNCVITPIESGNRVKLGIVPDHHLEAVKSVLVQFDHVPLVGVQASH